MAVVLVYGPPCGGKTTYALDHAKPGDLIVDHDLLAQAAGSDRTHNHYSEYRDAAEAEVDRLLDEVAAGRHPDAWVVRTAAGASQRAALEARLGAYRSVLCSAPLADLIARAQDRPDPIATVRAIHRWFDREHPSPRKRRHPAWDPSPGAR